MLSVRQTSDLVSNMKASPTWTQRDSDRCDASRDHEVVETVMNSMERLEETLGRDAHWRRDTLRDRMLLVQETEVRVKSGGR